MNFKDLDDVNQSKAIRYEMSVSKKAIEASEEYNHMITIGTPTDEAIKECLYILGGDLGDVVATSGVVRCSDNKLEGYYDTVYNLFTRWSYKKKHLWEDIQCMSLPQAPEGLTISVPDLGAGWVIPDEEDKSHEAQSKKQKRAVRTPKFRNEVER